MKGLRKNWLLGLVAILSALFLVAVACSDDEKSNTELLAQFCGDLEALGVTLEQVQAINLDSTVGELRTAKDDVNKAVDNVKSSAGDIASVSGLESAYENLESAVDDVSEDATISEALSSIESAVQGVVDSWNETAEAVECTASEATATTGPTEAAPTEPTATAEPTEEPAVNLVTNEWSITVDPASTSTGETLYVATNEGTIPHEIVYLLTDRPVDDLPLGPDNKVNRFADGIEDVGVIRTDALVPGATVRETFDLPAGNYALICNIPDHYEAGMFTAFVIQ